MKIKDFFNDNWKKIVSYIFVFCIGAGVTLSIVLPVNNRRIDRANSEIAVVRAELQSARAEVNRAGKTIDSLRTVQSDITNGLRDNNCELHSVIERLQLITEKTKIIEDILNKYYGSCINYYNYNGY